MKRFFVNLIMAFAAVALCFTACDKENDAAGDNLADNLADKYIEFEYENVKAICLENWDENSDGELSYGEAAAVASLAQIFKGKTDIVSFPELKHFTGLTSISESAFYGCDNLKYVYIPDSVTEIEKAAFDNCKSLQSVRMSKNVKSIGSGAFYFCSSLVFVELPEGLESVGYRAFYKNENLKKVTIPTSVTEIGVESFLGCKSLIEVICMPATPPTLKDNAFDQNAHYRKIIVPNDSVETYMAADGWSNYAGDIYDQDGNKGDGAESVDGPISFKDQAVKAICVEKWDKNGDGELSYVEAAYVNSLGHAFKENNDIESFDELQYFVNLTTIGLAAFSSCENLKSIVLPKGVAVLDDFAFSGCYALESIVIPETVTEIKEGVFYYCKSLREFKGKYATADGKALIIGDKFVSYAIGHKDTQYSIAEGVSTMMAHSMYASKNLTSITLPSSIKTIEVSAFGTSKNVSSLYCKAIEPPVLNESLINLAPLTIYVPKVSLDKYKNSDGWATYSTWISGWEF